MEADNLLWQCQIEKKKKEKEEKKQKALSIVGAGIMDMSEKPLCLYTWDQIHRCPLIIQGNKPSKSKIKLCTCTLSHRFIPTKQTALFVVLW